MARPHRTLSFRALLTLALLLLLIVTATVLVSLTTWFAGRNFHLLTKTIAEQTLARVEANVRQLLQKSIDQNRQAVQILQDRLMSRTNLGTFSNFLGNTLEAQPALARLTLALEPDGDFVQAERMPDRQIRIREGVHSGPGSFTLTQWDWSGGRRTQMRATNLPPMDLRDEPGFREAAALRRPFWTTSYEWEEPGQPTRWAVRNALPIHDARGKLKAVFSSSLTLDVLNGFLQEVDAQIPGYVSIFERGSSNRPARLIGHPQAQLVGLSVPGAGVASRPSPADPAIAGYIETLRADRQFSLTNHPRSDYAREYRVAGVPYLGSLKELSGADEPPWVIAMVLPVSEVAGGVERNFRIAAVTALGFLVLAVGVALWLARRIAQPMLNLSADAHAMSHLDFSSPVRPLSSIREVRQLEQALGEARSSLRSFRKYVPADVVNLLLESGAEAELGGHDARLTILFSDIADFTEIAEAATPQQLVEELGDYLAIVSAVIHEQRGLVDKFIGDGVMSFWGAPQRHPAHAAAACRTAWLIQQRLETFNARRVAAGRPPFHTRIGVNTGDVIVGNIGSDERMNYTVIGDAVNIASRLESLNRLYGTRILISEGTHLAAGDALLTRPVGRVAVKGSHRGISVHEILGPAVEADARTHRLAEATAGAFAALEKGQAKRALELYEALLAGFPGDGVARAQIQFLRELDPTGHHGNTGFIHRLGAK